MNSKFLKIVLICLILLTYQFSPLFCQSNDEISPDKLVKDFEEAFAFLEAHPDPFTHISEADFIAKYDSLKSTLDRPHTTLEFYKKVAALIALIKDGHSAVRLPKFWMRKQRKAHGGMPYEFHLTNDDELYVIKNFGEEGIPIGSKITKINGLSVDNFLETIDPYISYETKNFRNTQISYKFELFLYIAFGKSNNTIFEYFTHETATLQISNMPYKAWRKTQKDDRDDREIKISVREPYDYKKIDEGIGLLHIYSFLTADLKAFNTFLQQTFKLIRDDDIHSLIIDIRGNFGGYPRTSSRLFHYISDSYFKTIASSSMKVSAAYRNGLLNRYPILRRERFFFDENRHQINFNAILNGEIGTTVEEDILYNESPQTKKFEFTGDCYLLINRDSYSAASSFAATFQCYQMGVIIGEETGGTKIFRANAIRETLSKSGLDVSMSTTKNYCACYDEEFEGVEPTIEYTPSILEIVSGMDTQLFFTQRLIKQVLSERQKE